ncbi:uncharacterized protein BCR38DRAFT_432184 [Pseudomassariella vexata]|uniref:Uncharacterized protein n=1 Tax=Pseudomassariella vexata TaxID=1141098 RepID=A0A1Y2E2Z3_9PEZI|nr:uncharacterized protein BCR38DRAFT_432184 [Pseudomassariella vexata]ORY65235.1 hypothetical protein BCR38DRAFT_432184 [Pseudomassariella vexata]
MQRSTPRNQGPFDLDLDYSPIAVSILTETPHLASSGHFLQRPPTAMPVEELTLERLEGKLCHPQHIPRKSHNCEWLACGAKFRLCSIVRNLRSTLTTVVRQVWPIRVRNGPTARFPKRSWTIGSPMSLREDGLGASTTMAGIVGRGTQRWKRRGDQNSDTRHDFVLGNSNTALVCLAIPRGKTAIDWHLELRDWKAKIQHRELTNHG